MNQPVPYGEITEARKARKERNRIAQVKAADLSFAIFASFCPENHRALKGASLSNGTGLMEDRRRLD